ncbi:putative cytochrome P450 9f2 [Glossina fuscipes fuscipes]
MNLSTNGFTSIQTSSLSKIHKTRALPTFCSIWHSRVYGFFDQRQPVLLIRDAELLKQITVKDFNHFVNDRTVFGDEKDKNNLFVSSLFMMKDSRWKDMRSTLSPAFTGSKMRQMLQLMNKFANDATAYLKQQKKQSASQGLEIDVKNFATRYSNDIIASTEFSGGELFPSTGKKETEKSNLCSITFT